MSRLPRYMRMDWEQGASNDAGSVVVPCRVAWWGIPILLIEIYGPVRGIGAYCRWVWRVLHGTAH